MKELEEKLVEGFKEVLGRLGLVDEELIFRADRIEEMRSMLWDCVKSLSINRYENEEVESDYGYPQDYYVRPLEEQVKILQQYFPHLSFKLYGDLNLPELPEGAEGWFVIPKFKRIAETHYLAAEKIIRIINSSFSPRFSYSMCKKDRTIKALEECSLGSENDFVLFPAQFGLKHRGRSVRRASDMAARNEFFLGLYEVACMLLTHPERLSKELKTLGFYCAGDENHCYNGRELFDTPIFYWEKSNNTIEYRFIRSPEGSNFKNGVVSGFLYKS